jgi:hypothetical protein
MDGTGNREWDTAEQERNDNRRMQLMNSVRTSIDTMTLDILESVQRAMVAIHDRQELIDLVKEAMFDVKGIESMDTERLLSLQQALVAIHNRPELTMCCDALKDKEASGLRRYFCQSPTMFLPSNVDVIPRTTCYCREHKNIS